MHLENSAVVNAWRLYLLCVMCILVCMYEMNATGLCRYVQCDFQLWSRSIMLEWRFGYTFIEVVKLNNKFQFDIHTYSISPNVAEGVYVCIYMPCPAHVSLRGREVKIGYISSIDIEFLIQISAYT